MFKKLVLIISVLILSGCFSYKADYDDCVKKKDDLEIFIKNEKAERDVAFALVCNFGFPVCNQNAIQNGRKALAGGVSPNPNYYMFLLGAKAFIFAIFIALITFLLRYMHIRYATPAIKVRKQAVELVSGAEATARKTISDAYSRAQQIDNASKESERKALAKLNELKIQMQDAENQVEYWDGELVEKELHIEILEERLGDLDTEMNIRRGLLELMKYPYE